MTSFGAIYPEYSCAYNNPLNCDRPLNTAQEFKGAKFCLECGFPATLPQEIEIKGNWGTYQANNYLGVRGYGRIYSGVQVKDKQPVEIKEYLLPNRCFNEQETLDRKQIFQRVGGVKLADSRIQNFRLVNTIEAIADEKAERCYLITQKIDASQTLSQYITEKGKMTASQVRELLNQALQTLEFLHSQKLRFPSNQVQPGIAHGNINLHSILIKFTNNQNFSIYLCDLAIWENLFIPSAIHQPAPAQKEKDLESLGLVAAYLLAGRTVDYASNQPFNPRDNQQWSTKDTHLKQFIERLIGLGKPFISAEAARQALMQLPKEGQINNLSQSSETEPANQNFKKWYLWLLVLGCLLLGGGIFYYLLLNNQREDSNRYLAWYGLNNKFLDVPNIPSGKFGYTGENRGTWNYIIKQQVDNIVLNDLFKNPSPEAQAFFEYTPVSSNLENPDKPIAAVVKGEKDFAITSLTNNIPGQLDKKPVAYDGLLVYVAFDQQNDNLVDELNEKITLEQLRQIYTKKITNWRQISSKLPNIEIIPFKPTEPEAISKFKEIVLKNDPQDIALFTDKVTSLDTTSTQNQIRQESDKEKRIGTIAFGIISKVKGQCTGYPLAIADDNKPAIQPLFKKRDRRPIKTSDDLCEHDDYFFDVNNFKSYPLGYPIFVVYPKDNSRPPAGFKFSELLITRQGQCLLNKVGLVPLQPIPDVIDNYACKSLP
ncbi:substrate-binding domain-containing protein [Nostoc sp. FACHB-152]|uniref:substrate-binding domain-containing protein n=1 Tax=unclassified Nostoc TaxID=2593658 RepID=UPI001685706D|nr:MULTISPECIES: substrate-binding domain-containing protein [unclassified Nostoc]MBD2449260.1 substrate-binding domain-containing protein [Nostoc sp. FACHB-152]MBD2470462.1 substrate-binding domain-containing protein [Nostoc sp. FACHB-145]